MLEQTGKRLQPGLQPPGPQYQDRMAKALYKCAENLRLDLSLVVHLPVLCMS